MLREPHDRRALAGLERRERLELVVLGLLEDGVDRPAVRAALRVPEPLPDPFDHVVAERVAELVGVHVRLGRGVAHEVRQEPLDDPMLAHGPLGSLLPRLGEDRLAALAPLDEALGLEPLQHLAGRSARHAEHLGHARGERRHRRVARVVLADRERQEVDRLQVFVDGVPGCHLDGHATPGPPAARDPPLVPCRR